MNIDFLKLLAILLQKNETLIMPFKLNLILRIIPIYEPGFNCLGISLISVE